MTRKTAGLMTFAAFQSPGIQGKCRVLFKGLPAFASERPFFKQYLKFDAIYLEKNTRKHAYFCPLY